ncbi:hypothetical protein CIW54_16715 [Paraburkholderia sp. T12-10]|nr:hypothetical protein CIW54_16715 [Paraburkholderia sp. T12-10]
MIKITYVDRFGTEPQPSCTWEMRSAEPTGVDPIRQLVEPAQMIELSSIVAICDIQPSYNLAHNNSGSLRHEKRHSRR